MPWEKASTAGEVSSTAWELSSTASISGGAGDGLNEMLRKKFYVRREFFYVRRDIFYVASLWRYPYARQKGEGRRAGSGAGRCGRLTL